MSRLIVCADGTWNTPDRTDAGVPAPSNVVKLARAILPVGPDGERQIVYYDRGVGTDDLLDRITGGAFGVGLSRNVRNAYLFLVNNYQPGDEIFFFGFSRGAYTVRSTAGLIRKVGLVHKAHAERDLEAWNLYRRRDAGPDTQEAQDFRNTYSTWPIAIAFMGVWDTVGALGIPGLLNFVGRNRFQFHDVALSRSVQRAYQALAIDEKRRFFKPSIWQQNPEAQNQTLEQEWFVGVHGDVGGGYRDAGLANGALLWMMRNAEAAGLALDQAYLQESVVVDERAARHESRMFPYSLIPAYIRPIGRDNQRVSKPALDRYLRDAGYRPRNLVAFLEQARPGQDGGSAPGTPGAEGEPD